MTQPHEPPTPARAGVERCHELVYDEGHWSRFSRDHNDHGPIVHHHGGFHDCPRKAKYDGYCWQHRKAGAPD